MAAPGGFYEEDEPVEEIIAALQADTPIKKPRRKKPWLCKHGHWLSRGRTGTVVCFWCSRFAKETQYKRSELGHCYRGHRRPVGATNCPICTDWNSTPWHRELDETGKATCPKGHHVTPTDGMAYRGTRRWCIACRTEWNAANHALRREQGYAKKHGRNGLCNAQKHPWSDDMAEIRLDKRNKRKIIHCKGCRREYRAAYHWRKKREEEQRQPLPSHHLDWVVALHLIKEGSDELHSMQRGTSYGATVAEKWVAYCTWKAYNNREPEDFVPELHYARWRDEGIAAGFTRELDIWTLIGSLGDKEYLDSTLLFTTEK